MKKSSVNALFIVLIFFSLNFTFYNLTKSGSGNLHINNGVSTTVENALKNGTKYVIDPNTEITNVIANPSMGIQGTFVNISAVVTDNAGVQDVRLNITSPDSITINISIISNKTTSDLYYYMQDYYTVGTYTFFILAIDVNGYNIGVKFINIYEDDMDALEIYFSKLLPDG